jgi:16S rRNA (adenine1518-N6/adenine1519-N6)-dimethyltransferase
MTAIDDLPPLRETIRRHGLSARRSLGQNFLLDLNLTARIARAGGPLEGVSVVEIGPGPGGLTRALLAQGARQVTAIERDPRAIAALGEIAAHYPGRLIVIAGDAMEMDWNEPPPPGGGRWAAQRPGGGDGGAAREAPPNPPTPDRLRRLEKHLCPPPPGEGVPGTADPHSEAEPVRMVANLPYNIATALLVRWLSLETWPPWYDQMVLMFQREVAERIVAVPGSKVFGRLAVLAGWRTQARILFDVAPAAFVPPPKVTSSVVQLVPRPAPLPCSHTTLGRVTGAAFGQRRKMLRQSLRSLGDPQPLLDATGIDPTARAEDIAVEGFVALANALDAVDVSREARRSPK